MTPIKNILDDPFVRLISLAGTYKWWILLAVLTGFMTVGSSIGLLMTSAYIISKAALHPSIAELQLGIVGVRFFGIARGVFRYLERYIGHEVTFRLLAGFRVFFYKSLIPVVPAGLARRGSGDLLGRVTRDIEELQYFYTRLLAPPGIALLVTVLMWFLLGVYNWMLPVLLTFGLMIAATGIPALFRTGMQERMHRLSALHGRQKDLLIDQLRGRDEILAFNQQPAEVQRLAHLTEEISGMERRLDMSERISEQLIQWILQLTMLLAILIIVPDIIHASLDGVYMAGILLGIISAFEVAAPLAAGIDQKEAVRAAANRMFEISSGRGGQGPDEKGHVITEEIEQIRFRQVSFGYEPEFPVIRDLDLLLEKGKVYGLTGASGAGKTTLVRLLFRFLEPQSGTIGINRRPLSELPQKYLFSQIALMEQHPAFFSDSLRDNLTLGNETIGEDRIGDVLRRTDMDPVRDRLPGGLGSRIGVEGRHLSGGERQRLAFARTLLYARPVMIFDEPLAHLNPELAEKLLSAIIALRQGHIVLLISHQPRYLEKTDQILVMDQGKIAERGTYSELMARQEYFYAITRAQRGKNLDI